MNTALQRWNADNEKAQADMFFNAEPVVTDWDHIRAEVAAGRINQQTCLATIKDFEPLREADFREHAHWVAQQTLRLALLHEAGKPLEGRHTCEGCGSRLADPLHDQSEWRKICLHCAEKDRQSTDERSRGSCEFLRPCYNPRSHSWGLLYYWSHGLDNTFIFWLADFYKTRLDAQRALTPIRYYHQWLTAKYNDLIVHWLSFSRLLPIEDVMTLQLPLTPDQFRAHLHGVIDTDMRQEHRLMSYYVNDAMEKHEHNEKDK